MSPKENAQILTTLLFKNNIKQGEYFEDKSINCNNWQILATHSRHHLGFYDLYRNHFLSCVINPNFFFFSLKTKDDQGHHHSFFHATTFKKLVVQYVNSLYKNPLLMSRFNPDSDNYQQFLKKFKKHQNKLQAIKNTWTDQSNRNLGYLINDENDIILRTSKKDPRNILSIDVTYRKKK